MNAVCQRCGTDNPRGARFCQGCGFTLAATLAQGRTVVAPPTAPLPMSDAQVTAVTQRAQLAFGDLPMSPTGPGARSTLDQREHTVFVIDHSGSMGEPYIGGLSKLEAAKRANITMIVEKEQIDPDDECGVVVFDHEADILLPLSPLRTDKRQIIEAVQSTPVSGGTDINKGLEAARTLFDWGRSDVVPRIVLLTDGHGGHPIRTAEDLKSNGVVIDVIGVGPEPSRVDEKLLRKVASVIEGETRYRFIKDQHTLVAHYTRLANKTSTRA